MTGRETWALDKAFRSWRRYAAARGQGDNRLAHMHLIEWFGACEVVLEELQRSNPGLLIYYSRR